MTRLYSDLAGWYHLVTAPEEYVEEARLITALIDAAFTGPTTRASTLLELGCGGGNNASHLKARFDCTLTDLAPDILDQSRRLNPTCRHVAGDMRSLRVDRTFDAVLAHDAIGYLLTRDDLQAGIATAAHHLAPGGVALFIPDADTACFAPGVTHGGLDGADGRGARYLEWTHPLNPDGVTYNADYSFLLRAADGTVRAEHDRHTLAVFSPSDWQAMIRAAGLTPLDPVRDLDIDPADVGLPVIYVGQKPAG